MAPVALFALAASLLALPASVSASNPSSGAIILGAEDVLNRPYVTIATSSLLHRRGDNGNSSTSDQFGVTSNADGTLNLTAWDSATINACTAVLNSLHQSSNPSGACVCYNLPSLDTDTGVFEADLRVFKVSEPRGNFAGIAPEDVTVSLSYNGASVMSVDPKNVTGSGIQGSVAKIVKRSSLELLQSYMFIGQIDKDRMKKNLTMSSFETLLIPTLTLTGRNSSGDKVQTNVSINEASFLTGVFSQEVILSDFGAAQKAVDDQVAGLKNGTVAFILPGVQLMVYPIGLIITSTWLLIGVTVYGFGTYERYKYAELYRRRKAVSVPRKNNQI
ncbi:hypothetical protein BGZ63DRAFT_428462 [Mariannaea sp. PMI_226]|nr:hypothetical protein BGZ63DRAFT_428462 [Mariannaea sp. PMI_226]